MLCIIALSCCFSGVFFCFSLAWIEIVVFEKNITMKEGLIAKNMTEKTTKRGLRGSHKKDRASHEVRMVGIFCGWGLPRCAARN
jgi:hypothetical protein